jgi:ABC-type glycerol-3-phosphate transport system substrate-binding protein
VTYIMNRRRFLQGTAAVGLGATLSAPYINKGYAASGKIVVGTEAGSPYDTFYKKHAADFTKAMGVEVEFNAIPHDSIRQTFVQDAVSGGGGFDVYIADQVWLPEFYEKGFISDISGQLSDADKADFSKTAIETVARCPSGSGRSPRAGR